MKFNLKNIWVPALTIVLGYGSYVLGMCGVTRSCSYYSALNGYSLTVLDPIFTFSLPVIPLAITLLFVNNGSFKQWLRFAAWWIPLSVILIALSKTNGNSWMPLYPEATKSNVALTMGCLFTIISLIQIKRHSRVSVRKQST